MARVKCWQVDAFTDRPFSGNPAAVCLLETEAETTWMQAVAAEMNLPETAFVRAIDGGYDLRWFTPLVEVDLCGHATLATAFALWSDGLAPREEPLRFQTRSGLLTCTSAGEFLELDFPATPPVPVTPPAGLLEALGTSAVFVGQSKFDYLVVVDNEAAVRVLKPDFQKLGRIPTRGVIVTAQGNGDPFDCVSRFFAPTQGIDEDPVCGSAHCCLGPFWAERLGKTELTAYQASARSGVLRLRVLGDRVKLGGQAVCIWKGELV